MSTIKEFVASLWDRDNTDSRIGKESADARDWNCASVMLEELGNYPDLADCPIASNVGFDCMEVLFKTRELIDLLSDATTAELRDVCMAAMHQCCVFWYG